MIRSTRATFAVTILAGLGLILGACTSSVGALGTPSSPRVTPASSADASPSDEIPATAALSGAPSPTTAQSTAAASSGSTGPTSGNPASGNPSSGNPASAGPASAGPTSAPATTPAPAGITIVRAYFMLGSLTDNPGLVPVLRTVPETKGVARAAMTALLAGPAGDELEGPPAMYSAIPAGTQLLGISIADGVATVNLSGEYLGAVAGLQGGTADAQVVYTLTQFSTVKLVRIEVDGQAPGGAVGRSDFQQVGILPAIFVDRPAWGAAAGNPARVSGIANVFEATFRVQVRDGNGKVAADQQVMASCGTGCWGTFQADVPYAVARAQYGTLRVFNLSAKDGSVENLTEYKVWLSPAG